MNVLEPFDYNKIISAQFTQKIFVRKLGEIVVNNLNKIIVKQIINIPETAESKNKITKEWTIEQLKLKLISNSIIKYKYNQNKEIPIFKKNAKLLSGEKFKAYERTLNSRQPEIEISNLGRSKDINNNLIEQKEQNINNFGYLALDVWGYKSILVCRLVAETWLEKDISLEKEWGNDWEIHHISNDGYDNRAENLIWLPKDIHRKIGYKK